MTMADLVADDFEIPATLVTPLLRLRMLGASDCEADYQAVMESQTRLRAGSPNGWPHAGFTLAENLADLERHEQEFLSRQAFAYTVVTPAEDRVLGCVYINPSEHADVDVYMWIRDSHHAGLAAHLHESVSSWLESCWPFEQINYIRTDYYLSS